MANTGGSRCRVCPKASMFFLSGGVHSGGGPTAPFPYPPPQRDVSPPSPQMSTT